MLFSKRPCSALSSASRRSADSVRCAALMLGCYLTQPALPLTSYGVRDVRRAGRYAERGGRPGAALARQLLRCDVLQPVVMRLRDDCDNALNLVLELVAFTSR